MGALDKLHKGKSLTHERSNVSLPFTAFIWDTKYRVNVQRCSESAAAAS